MDVQDRFASLAADLGARAGVDGPAGGRGFGARSIRVHGRIFAMLSGDRLVLKLPAARVAEIIAAGQGAAFDANKGRPMREWVALGPDCALDWDEMAAEAWRYGSHPR